MTDDAGSLDHNNRTAVAEGRDTVSEKRVARESSRKQTPSIPTFAEARSHVIKLRRPTWSNIKHADQWRNTLAAYANPLIGSKPVDEVDSSDVLAVLTPIWTVKSETRAGYASAWRPCSTGPSSRGRGWITRQAGPSSRSFLILQLQIALGRM